MKNKFSDWLTISLFCGFLMIMTSAFLILPKTDFSETEKRYLAEAPLLDWDTLTSGEWGDEIETYLADHIPGRNFFVGLNAYFDLLTGRQSSKDIRIHDGWLLEAPVEWSDAAVQKNMTAIQSFADQVGQRVDLAVIPSAGWASGLDGYSDAKIISEIYDLAGGNLNPVDMLSVFQNGAELYYKTDHHWTSRGAHEAYRAYMEAIGRNAMPEDSFRKESCAGFQGSTYSRSALWLTPGEELELWHGSPELTVTNAETSGIHDGVFYRERLDEADKYTVFLDGNHSLVRVSNPSQEGKLLVIRDSYSNCLGCFLAESFGEVVLVDLRYYKQPVSQLAAEEKFDHILVCYSVGNFLTDTNIVWLR